MSDERFDQILDELADELDPREREELAARLSMAADPIAPDPAVRERILARIGAPRTRVFPPARRDLRPLLAAAAAAGIAALVTFSVMASRPLPAPVPDPEAATTAAADREEIEELSDLLAEQDDEIAALEAELARMRDALSVLGADRVERLDLVSAAHPDALARVYWDWDEYSCWFVADGLPAPASGRRYALWLFTDTGEVLRAGDFDAGGAGSASFFAMLPKDMGKVVRAVVTEEPETIGETPTGEPVLEGPATRAS